MVKLFAGWHYLAFDADTAVPVSIGQFLRVIKPYFDGVLDIQQLSSYSFRLVVPTLAGIVRLTDTYESCLPVLLSALGESECIGNENLAEVCTRGARSVGCWDCVTLTKAPLNRESLSEKEFRPKLIRYAPSQA